MNRNRLLVAIVLGTLIFVFPVLAQRPATQPQPRPQVPATQTTTAVAVPISKVAIIFSEAFQDPKNGISKFNVLMNKLNNDEFGPRQKRLDNMAQQIRQLQDEIAKLQTQPTVPANIQAKLDQVDQLKKQAQRETEDGQALYQKRRQELFGPLQDDIGKALDAYAKAHGITLIIDGSQVQGILYAADSLDITKAFISEYNSKNPVTAAATTPK
ncbi:MAG TPA: OmpH family outer membrane protein [Pyrinomonadaceae bacterium]|nr:OmpH family outer membrane protein [Pyrinomonadaceae bacterium]